MIPKVKILTVDNVEIIQQKYPSELLSDAVGKLLASLGNVPYAKEISTNEKNLFLSIFNQ